MRTSRGTVAGRRQFFTRILTVDWSAESTYIGSMTIAKNCPDELGPASKASDVDKLVLATVNAPYRRNITVSILRECLLKADAGDWLVHVATFFTDVSSGLIFDFAASHGISKSRLAQAYLAMKIKTGEFNLDLEDTLVPLATVA